MSTFSGKDQIEDKEIQKERKRIITAIHLFNYSCLHSNASKPLTKYTIIYYASAFEALLNLPTDKIQSSFEISISTLFGQKSANLSHWCKLFYGYRSKIVHGETGWDDKEEEFTALNGKHEYHSRVAHNLFINCLYRKLFLADYLDVAEYKHIQIDLKNILA